MKELGETWGRNVARRRSELGFTQAELAERCGRVTQQTISKIERGVILPRDSLKLLIAIHLQSHPAELFGWPEATPTATSATGDASR